MAEREALWKAFAALVKCRDWLYTEQAIRHYGPKFMGEVDAAIAALKGAELGKDGAILRELVVADNAWRALPPVLRLQEADNGETRLQSAWKAAREHVAGLRSSHEACSLCEGSGWAMLEGMGGGLATCPDCFGTGLPPGSLDCPQCLENPCKCAAIYGTPDEPPF